jgi:hypothetical protein
MKNHNTLARTAACLLLSMAGVHAHAHAEQASHMAASDPQAAVPATRYQPALQTLPAPAADASPDRNWVAANQKAATTNSMALTMKTGMGGMAGMAGMDMGKHPDAPAMCTPGGAGSGEGMQCKGGDKGGEGKMACCAACPCMNKAKDAAAPAAAPSPTADPHAHHQQGTQ